MPRGVVGHSYLGKGCLMTPPEVSLFCSCSAKSIPVFVDLSSYQLDLEYSPSSIPICSLNFRHTVSAIAISTDRLPARRVWLRVLSGLILYELP